MTGLSKHPRPLIMAFVILLCGWAYWTFVSTASSTPYPRVQFWIDAAKCAKKTGHYLVVCDPAGHEVPLEDVSLADDRGHTLILSFVVRAFDIDPSLSILRNLNLLLGLFGFAHLVANLYFRIGWQGSTFTALLGAYWLGGRASADVDAGYIGIVALSASALITAADLLSKNSKPLKATIGLLFIFTAFAFTSIIRQPIGLGAACALLILIGVAAWLRQRNFEISRFVFCIRSAVLILIAIVVVKIPMLPSSLRDHLLQMKPVGTAAHGLSHNLFLGLGGFVDNKWGIVWDDAYAEQVMRGLYPDIKYCSDEYFKKIGELYWSYVKADPAEAVRVYATKISRTLSASEGPSWSVFISLILCIAVYFYTRRNCDNKFPISQNEKLYLIGPALFGLSFIGQGILTHPAWTYIYPGPVLIMVVTAMWTEKCIENCR